MKFWCGNPTACDACHAPLGHSFVDGWTPRGWGILCDPCHGALGRGLGIGRGQRYEKQTDGKWLQTAGGAK